MLATAPARAEVRSPSSSVSPARLAANRLNAQKSTGPRTAEGKGRSSQNALKHGLCSGAAVLPGECAEAFDAFGRELDEELRPRGSAQRVLFEQIHNLAWKLRRVWVRCRRAFLGACTRT